ncbi:restriction endonuclease [Pelagibacterium flavum]|uniref:Restriction endonuclease n=1 Tax=Pelagibacterium flavum TaxID=2984530 RepID=A0ABY6ISB2_9HYPH|nr:BglII/BstYI family type II restriction endonuclease [Pelagibacterium sp. YIM 151497]UYQ73463.1 restriction endonuclease [Pelagibacterium sp. YIM 151497]
MTDSEDEIEVEDLDIEGDEVDVESDDATLVPSDAADPQSIVDAKVPEDIRKKFDVVSYRNAAVILAESRKAEFEELLTFLRDFKITTTMIRTAGGNESDIPKLFSAGLRQHGWHETTISGDLVVRLDWKEQIGITAGGKPKFEKREAEIRRENYLDGHKIDYVKNKVAFDLEWNSKDQTFDRDLFAFSTFFLSGAIDVGVLVTRSASLNPVFRDMGPALKKNGDIEMKDGQPRPTAQKYGASTTWMGKLIYRLNAGRNGGCPVLAVGIRPECISDWPPAE